MWLSKNIFGVGNFVSENLVSEILFRKIRCRKNCCQKFLRKHIFAIENDSIHANDSPPDSRQALAYLHACWLFRLLVRYVFHRCFSDVNGTLKNFCSRRDKTSAAYETVKIGLIIGELFHGSLLVVYMFQGTVPSKDMQTPPHLRSGQIFMKDAECTLIFSIYKDSKDLI